MDGCVNIICQYFYIHTYIHAHKYARAHTYVCEPVMLTSSTKSKISNHLLEELKLLVMLEI